MGFSFNIDAIAAHSSLPIWCHEFDSPESLSFIGIIQRLGDNVMQNFLLDLILNFEVKHYWMSFNG